MLHGSLVKSGLSTSVFCGGPKSVPLSVWIGGQGALLTYTCRFSGDLNILITGFPVLGTDLPQAPVLPPVSALWSRLCIFCRIVSTQVTFPLGVRRTDPSPSHSPAPSWEQLPRNQAQNKKKTTIWAFPMLTGEKAGISQIIAITQWVSGKAGLSYYFIRAAKKALRT